MFEPRTCHLINFTALFCIGIDRLGLAVSRPRHGADIVVSKLTKLGG